MQNTTLSDETTGKEPAAKAGERQARALGREGALEKEVAPQPSALAWRIPWREEPGRLQPSVRGVAKSRTRLSDFTFTFFHSSFKMTFIRGTIFSVYTLETQEMHSHPSFQIPQ